MEKREDGLGKPGMMIDCRDGSFVALRDDGDLRVVMEILIKRWQDDASNCMELMVDRRWKKMADN